MIKNVIISGYYYGHSHGQMNEEQVNNLIGMFIAILIVSIFTMLISAYKYFVKKQRSYSDNFIEYAFGFGGVEPIILMIFNVLGAFILGACILAFFGTLIANLL